MSQSSPLILTVRWPSPLRHHRGTRSKSDMVVYSEYDEISPSSPYTDNQMDEVDTRSEPRADEHDAFTKKHMPQLELVDQETEEDFFQIQLSHAKLRGLLEM
ncbi:hypothetical protein FB567DRAFT_598410 [Paraphoma chrysanthemicola]|uniref:Uncharacterized protein n=1 Tax=Paraphoma chrysanthemicola TaxID=798071 RepID=A0A8K0QTV8_9PLEO|nr:hypothetical protein FB567DRAFT_598410 [Paraphoma chrysanthemicola]